MSIELNGCHVLPFDGAIKGYTLNFLKKNKWKVSGYLEFEDLMQEAYATYLLIKDRYGTVVDSQAHFMSLYKSSLRNKITDLSLKATDHRKNSTIYDQVDEDSEDSILDLLVGLEDNEAIFDDLVANAPSEIKSVINYVTQPEKSVEENQKFWSQQERIWKLQGKKKFLGNEYLCSRLGFDHNHVDLVGMTIEHFTN